MNKVLNLRLNRFVPAGLVALAAAVLLAPAPASATPYIVNLVQQGSNVVATGSGEFDLSGLQQYSVHFDIFGYVRADLGTVQTGSGTADGYYDSTLTGPTNIGVGGWPGTQSSTDTGDAVGLAYVGPDGPSLFVPEGYVSGTTLSSGSTWDNASFASLGVTPDTYVWSWGSGADQSFTLIIGGGMPTVPEPAALGMFGFGVLLIGGFVGLRRRAA